MRFLVTGASGFVGRAAVRAMAAKGAVRAVARTGKVAGAVQTVLVHDIAGEVDWSPHLTAVDAVLHLAARVHVMHDTETDPMAAFRRTNVEGTRRLAEAAANAGVRRFVFVSSVKVHGEVTHEQPFRPASPLRPADPYGQSKAEAEQVLRDIEAHTGLEVVVVRPPLVYGQGVRANFLSLMRAVDRGIPLPFGRVQNRRSLVFVENLADLLVLAATAPEAAGETYLVSDGAAVSTADLVRGMAQGLDRSARLVPVPPGMLRLIGRILKQGAAVNRLLGSLEVDGSEALGRLGWLPPVSMRDGIQATTDWFRRELSV